jgi:hypothetical protein
VFVCVARVRANERSRANPKPNLVIKPYTKVPRWHFDDGARARPKAKLCDLRRPNYAFEPLSAVCPSFSHKLSSLNSNSSVSSVVASHIAYARSCRSLVPMNPSHGTSSRPTTERTGTSATQTVSTERTASTITRRQERSVHAKYRNQLASARLATLSTILHMCDCAAFPPAAATVLSAHALLTASPSSCASAQPPTWRARRT